MADPLSIIGTATGLVSLGLQVYGGIKDYLDLSKLAKRTLPVSIGTLPGLKMPWMLLRESFGVDHSTVQLPLLRQCHVYYLAMLS